MLAGTTETPAPTAPSDSTVCIPVRLLHQAGPEAHLGAGPPDPEAEAPPPGPGPEHEGLVGEVGEAEVAPGGERVIRRQGHAEAIGDDGAQLDAPRLGERGDDDAQVERVLARPRDPHRRRRLAQLRARAGQAPAEGAADVVDPHDGAARAGLVRRGAGPLYRAGASRARRRITRPAPASPSTHLPSRSGRVTPSSSQSHRIATVSGGCAMPSRAAAR